MTYEVKTGTAADRKLIPSALPEGHLGWSSDELEHFIGSSTSPFGRVATPPDPPRYGLDSRRLWVASSQGQQNTWTDVGSVAQDASGMVLSPKPHGSAGTDIVATGYIGPYELADGGEVVITACGTYKCGSILPRILAKLSIGGTYVAPQYEAMMVYPRGNTAAPFDILVNIADCFEWSSNTIGANALAGYEALYVDAANLTKGEFQWNLTMRLRALGRYAKWQRGDDDSATKDRNVWVEATLEWGALQYNAGGRIGVPFGFANPLGQRTLQYNAFVQNDTSTPANGTLRGSIYSFLGTQWLCHAASGTGALIVGASAWTNGVDYVYGDIVSNGGSTYRCVYGHTAGTGVDEPGVDAGAAIKWVQVYYDPEVWPQMLSEEAPGMGVHWREFFVPAVQRATISGFATMDNTVGNQVQLELGGPQQVDPGVTTFSAYGATTSYTPEAGVVEAAGVKYASKAYAYTAAWPRMVAGVQTALTTAAPPDARYWRALPTTLRDEMRVQTTQAYLFGRRNGVTERRV